MNDKYRSPLAFIDFLFILLLAFVSMFILALLLINPVTKQSEIERKAEYLAIMEWDDESKDDVDIWIQNPLGQVLSFRTKTAGLMHLDKDDWGTINDTLILPSGERQVIYLNREVVTFRGWKAGEYILNIHMFNKRTEDPTNIRIRVIRINPYSTLFEEKIVMTKRGEEYTVRRFTLDEMGVMISTDKTPMKFVNDLHNTGSDLQEGSNN